MPSKDTEIPNCGIDQTHGPHGWSGGPCPGSGTLRVLPPDPMEQLHEDVLAYAARMWPGDYDGTVLSTHELVNQVLDRLERAQAPEPPAPERVLRDAVLHMVDQERDAQDDKWGRQRHPDGTGPRVPFVGSLCYMANMAEQTRRATNSAAGKVPGLEHHGPLTWRHILLEEVFEALAESDPHNLLDELIQTGAVCAAWAEDLLERLGTEADEKIEVDG